MLCPLLIQLITTPMHLLGLDYYNNQNRNFKERLIFMKKIAGYSILIRMMRFLPTYGIAGIINISLREKL